MSTIYKKKILFIYILMLYILHKTFYDLKL